MTALPRSPRRNETLRRPPRPPPAAAHGSRSDKPAAPAAAPPQQPSLDDLLGTKPKPAAADAPKPGETSDAKAPPSGEAPDQSKTDLDRLLTAEEIGDAFKQAVTLMGDASKRLSDHADPGLDTQRVQEDVVKRLDQLLASMQKQQSQGSPSQQPKDPKQSPGPSKPQSSTPQNPKGDGMKDHLLGPTLQEGELKPELEFARAAWGSLPARGARHAHAQGTEDRFSARYKALTQAYYKRLAEESSK